MFAKEGCNLVLTETGCLVFSYADKMFCLGLELQDVLAGGTPGAALTLRVGKAMVVPKLLAYRVLEKYGVALVARTEEITEHFYAISTERRIKHPTESAIAENARSELFR